MWSETRTSQRVFIFLCLVAYTLLMFVIFNREYVTRFIFAANENRNQKTKINKTTAEIQNSTDEVMIDTSRLDKNAGFRLINGLVGKGLLDFSRVASYPLEDEWLTPMDIEILADEPVKNLSTVASEKFSTIQLVSLPKDGKLTVGGKVTVRVDIKDATGKPVLKGGHRVRVWMVQEKKLFHGTNHTTTSRLAAARVTDKRNGSFEASFPVLWDGRTEVRAALVRSREFQRMFLHLMSIMKMMNQNIAVYSFNKTEQ